MTRHLIRSAGVLSLAAAMVLGSLAANAQTKIRVTLDWIPQSPHALHFIPHYNGAYKAAGLDVKIDAGRGSADAVRKLVAGTHDLGLADINALIQYNSKHPGKEIKLIFMMLDRPPFSIFVMKKSGITSPKQLVGKTLGAPVFDASYKLFPAFAKAIGIDHTKVKRKNMDPRLREVMLMRGEVDAISGHFYSSMINIKAAGYKESDVRYFMYGDHGMESYANGIAVRPDFLAKHPDAVRRFVKATIDGAREMVLNPKAAVASAKKFEPLIDSKVETDRLALTLRCCILSPEVIKNGYGDVDMGRLQRSINQAALAYGLKRIPKATDMFDKGYLPPKAERFIHK